MPDSLEDDQNQTARPGIAGICRWLTAARITAEAGWTRGGGEPGISQSDSQQGPLVDAS